MSRRNQKSIWQIISGIFMYSGTDGKQTKMETIERRRGKRIPQNGDSDKERSPVEKSETVVGLGSWWEACCRTKMSGYWALIVMIMRHLWMRNFVASVNLFPPQCDLRTRVNRMSLMPLCQEVELRLRAVYVLSSPALQYKLFEITAHHFLAVSCKIRIKT